MLLVASITGLAAGVALWFALSYFTTNFILSIEKRRPHLVGTRLLRLTEVTVCGGLVLAAFALAIWLASVIWLASR